MEAEVVGRETPADRPDSFVEVTEVDDEVTPLSDALVSRERTEGIAAAVEDCDWEPRLKEKKKRIINVSEKKLKVGIQ